MKHTYSGNDLRSHGRMPAGGPPPQPPQHAIEDQAAPARGWLAVVIAVLAVLLVGMALALVWAMHGREQPAPEPGPAPAPQAAAAPEGGAAAESEAGAAVAADAEDGLHFLPGMTTQAMLEEYLNYRPLKVKQLFEYVRNSEHVQGNAHYAGLMEKVQFVYEDGNDAVNAYAVARGGGEGGEAAQEIHCLAGAGRFARLISLALAAELAGQEGAVHRLLDAMEPEQFGALTEKDAVRLLDVALDTDCIADAALRKDAASIASGMLLAVLAHESGHHALGHVFGNASNLEISRNQEREADTFASSVISSSEFGEYMFEGMLFWHYALALQQEGASGEGTHPLAKERLASLIQQNPGMAAAWGIEAED